MKVKRFLLRYDPPGLGIQVDTLGEETLQHVDLPASSEVTSVKHIRDLVDDLLKKHEMLLSGERHGSALVKLLGRLYKIDCGADEAKDFKSQGKKGNMDSEFNPELGQRVVVIKQTGKLQVHNGEIGKVSKVRADKGSYEVTIGEDLTVLKLRGVDSFFLLASGDTVFAPGTPVVICKLRNHADLNGCLGHVVKSDDSGQRFEVRAMETRQLFRVKRENLIAIAVEGRSVPPPFEESNAQAKSGSSSPPVSAAAPRAQAAGAAPAPPASDYAQAGAVVVLHGLKTALEFNGQTATILSVDRVKGRYEIKLADGNVKTVRAENVRFKEGG